MEIDSSEEIVSIREFFRSLPESEQRRLIDRFADGLEARSTIPDQDWSDKAPDGSRKAPESSVTMAASNKQ